MPSPRFRRQEQILRDLINRTVARSGLTSVDDASSIKHVLSAVARFGDEFYYQLANTLDAFSIDNARGDDLDRRAAEIMGVDQRRRLSSKAVGSVIFGRAVSGSVVTVPVGTTVKTASGIEFVTTAVGTFGSGDLVTGAVAVIARVAGLEGNVGVASVTKFGSKPAGVQTVTNTAAFTQGGDKETDDQFRSRIRDYVASLARCTPRALEFAARSVELASGQRVVFAKCVEDAVNRGESILYIDDGAGTAESTSVVANENVTAGLAGPPIDTAAGGETRLFLDAFPVKRAAGFVLESDLRGVLVEEDTFYLDETSGQLFFDPALEQAEALEADYTVFTGLLAEVQKVINGDPNDRVNYPGFRAAGTRVVVLSPGIFQQTVEASLIYAEGSLTADVKPQVASAIAQYINTLGIGGDVIRAELIAAIMDVPGVVNTQLVAPVDDVPMLDDQLPRIISDNIFLT